MSGNIHIYVYWWYNPTLKASEMCVNVVIKLNCLEQKTKRPDFAPFVI